MKLGKNVAKLITTRFPFTYHHDYMRTHLDCSRGEVAHILKEKFKDEVMYNEQVEAGAFMYLLKNHADAFLNDLLECDKEEVDKLLTTYRLIKRRTENIVIFTKEDYDAYCKNYV